MSVPRDEYPRPQFVRDRWLCLNGKWEFEIDSGDSGLERGLLQRKLAETITVPFCPESTLSGIGNTDYLNCVWYRRKVKIPAKWGKSRVLLHFQAVDYDATVWVNGQEVGRHRGGFTPFACDLSHVAKAGSTVELVVRARDSRSDPQPRGKQSVGYVNAGCHYTRTTGIWQSVWMEPVPQSYLRRTRIVPDVGGSRFVLTQPIAHPSAGFSVRAVLTWGKAIVADVTQPAGDFSPTIVLDVPEAQKRLWSIEHPHLYGLTVELLDATGKPTDRVQSYAGLRSISVDGSRILLNGKPVFQRLVLDQGWYPDGLLTAPTDQSLVDDIKLSMAAGFNGARLHQKVFEERFLYHADRMGYLCWGEFPDWSIDYERSGATATGQWLESIERDFSHPSIVGWCGLNETSAMMTDRIDALHDITRAMFLAARLADPTRPVLDASGYSHRVIDTDVYDSHDYDQKPGSFAERHAKTAAGEPHINRPWQPGRQNETISLPYRGQPVFVSEFGGIWWNPDAKKGEDSWGYGDRVKNVKEFYARFEGLCTALLQNPGMFGYCYTQLTDVFQEQNGIYRFDRSTKFDMKRIRKAQTAKAAVEK